MMVEVVTSWDDASPAASVPIVTTWDERTAQSSVAAAPAPTTVTLPETERPARMTLTRGGQAILQPDTAVQARQTQPGLSGETLDQLERSYRSLKQGVSVVDMSVTKRALKTLDLVDAGERLMPADDLYNFRTMDAPTRANVRGKLEAGYVDSLKTIALEAVKISALYHDPNAAEAIKAADEGRWKDAWEAFSSDPVGVVKDLSLSNAAQIAPMAAFGIAGHAIKGVPGLMLGFAGGSFPVDYAMSLVEYLSDQKIDLTDYKAVDAKLREPDFLDKLTNYAALHGTGVAAGDAAAGGLMSPIRGTLGQAAKAAGGNVLKGVAGEAGGEAAGEALATGTIKPGQVIAEGLAAGPMTVAGSVARTVTTETPQAQRARIVAKELEQAVSGATPAESSEMIAIDLLNPDRAQRIETVTEWRAIERPVAATQQDVAEQQQEPPSEPVGGEAEAAAKMEAVETGQPPAQAVAGEAQAAVAVLPGQPEEVPATEQPDAPEVFDTREAANMAARLQASEYGVPFKAKQHPDLPEKWIVEQVVRTEKQSKADERNRVRARMTFAADPNRDSITTFIAKLGGLRLSEAPDITRDRYPVRAPYFPMAFLIRRTGGMGVDEVGEYLQEAGYFIERPDEDEIREAIIAELDSGKRHFSIHGDAAIQALAEENDAKALEEFEAAVAFAEEAGVPDIEQVVPESDWGDVRNFVPAGEPSNDAVTLATAQLTQRATELDADAVERLAIQSEGMSDGEYLAALQEIVNAKEQDVQDGTRGVGEAVEPYALAGETEADIRAREDGERARRETEQREAAERDARTRADRERGGFGLTGSDRAADRQGEGNLFSLSPAASRNWTEITNGVAELAQRITPTVTTRAVASIWSQGRSAEDGGPTPVGRYNIPHNLIEVSFSSPDYARTFRHEAVHALRQLGLFTPQEWRLLEAQSRKTWRRQFDIDARYEGQKLDEDGLNEEGVADAFGRYQDGTLNAQPPVQKVMRKIAEFFRRLGNLLRGMGFQTVEDIFERVESGEVGRREGAGEAATEGGDKFAMRPIPRGLAPSVPPGVQQAYIASATRSLRRQRGQPATPFSDIGSIVDRAVKPRTIAAFFGESIPAYNTLIAEQQFRDEKFAEYTRLAEPYFLAPKEDRAVIDKVLEHDRLTGQIGLAGVNMTVGFTSPDARLSTPGERVTVTPEQKAAYWGARRMLDQSFTDFKARLLEDFNLRPGMTVAQIRQMAIAVPPPMPPAQRGAFTRRVKELTAAANALEAVEQAYRAGYFPFSRFGNVGIAVKDANGTTIEYVTLDLGPINRKRAHNLKWDRIPEVKAELERLRSKYQGTTAVIGTPFEIPAGKFAKEVKLADVDVLAEIGKIDSAEWDAIRQQLIAGQAAQGYRAHLFRAKNTPGYSTDFERVLANYINQAATFQARRKFAKQWNAAINNIDAGRMGKLRKYWTDLAEYVHDGTEEHSALRATTFVYYLTSIASWVTNLTQTVTTVAPLATQYANPLAVTAAMSRAWLESGRMLSAKATWQHQFYDPTKAPIDVRGAVQKAWDEGQFVNVVTRDYMGLARNSHPILKKLTPGAQKVVEIAGAGFTVAEMQNRIATYIAMYRLARDNPNVRTRFAAQMANNAVAADLIANWSPAGFAEFMNDEGNFKQGKINRARLERGVGTVVTQFWGYTWNFLERLYTLVALQGTEGRAAAALMLGIMAFLTGIWGLPGLDRLRQLIEFLNRKVFKNDLDMDREMRKLVVEVTNSFELAYMMSGGITRATGGPDLAARVGMGNLFNTPVFLDLAGRLPDAMEQFEVNNTKLAIAEMLPKQAGDILIAQAWGEQGFRTAPSATGKDKQIIPPDHVTAGMRAQKALGFTPAEVSERLALERAEKRIERSTDEVRRDWYSRMAKAQYAQERAEAAGNPTEAAKWENEIDGIWAEIDKWNNSHKDSEFVRLDPATRRENVRREREGAERQKGKRKAARGEIQSIQDLYNTELR